jgi:hypothetical protein
MDGLQLTKAQQQGRARPVPPVLTSFVTDDGTFADPQFDGSLLLRPAQGLAKGTDARPRGQQHWTLRQRRDRLRWLLVSQSLGPLQSRKRRVTAVGCDDRCKHSTINKLSARFPGSSTVEHSAVNRRVASSNLARGANSKSRSQSDLCCLWSFASTHWHCGRLRRGSNRCRPNIVLLNY